MPEEAAQHADVIFIGEAESSWPRFLAEFATLARLPHLQVKGLMTMPPLTSIPEDSRRYFSLLAALTRP